MSKLTEEQQNFMNELRNEIQEVVNPILTELREHREEECGSLKRTVTRMAKSLLALFGDKEG